MKINPKVLVLSVLLLLPSAVVGQETPEEKEERRQSLQRKAYVLIDEIASAALGLKLPENRSIILAETASLLWEHDEKRARTLFWDALNTLNLTTVPPSRDKKTTKDKDRDLRTYYTQFGIRQELLRKVTRHDPQLALDLLRSSHLEQPEVPSGYLLVSDKEIEQEIAAEAAARDPKRALQIARESLSKGISFQLLDLVEGLNNRDSELGSKFAGEVIDKMQTQNLSADVFGFQVAVQLVLMSRPAVNKPPNSARQLKLEREQRRTLIEIIANAALGLSANPNLLYAINEILPEFDEFAPERVPLLQKKLTAFNQTLNKDQRGWNEHNRLVRTNDPEAMFKGASALGDEQRNSLQQQALIVAVFLRKADEMRKLINEVEDESRRNSLFDALDAEQIDRAVAKGDSDELRKLVSQVRLREERARAMIGIAVQLEKKGEHDEAVKLLDEARTMIKVDFDSETQKYALLSLVGAYAIVDPPKAFAILEKTIDRANDQISKLLLVDKIIKTGVIRKGEVLLHKASVLPLDFLLFRFGKGVGALATADYERTKAAADRLDRQELRLLARLMLARSLVDFTYKQPGSEKRG